MENQEIIIKKSDLNKFISSLPAAGPFGKEALANAQRTVIVNKNVTGQEKSKKAEIHENYVDVFIVIDGREELFIGGELKDKENISPGEWLGENLENSRRYNIEAGDVVIIPKGIAHQHGEGVVKMLVIKIS